jgi:hypothetical protein
MTPSKYVIGHVQQKNLLHEENTKLMQRQPLLFELPPPN